MSGYYTREEWLENLREATSETEYCKWFVITRYKKCW